MHDKEYGTKEQEDWTFEGTETLYRGLFNLVGNRGSKGSDFKNSKLFSSQVNHMEELTPSKEMETIIKSAVLLRYVLKPS